MTQLIPQLEQLYAEGMARPAREIWPDPRVIGMTEFKHAAVLVAITDRVMDERSEPGLLLIHRPDTMRSHPGQVAFPGGRLDPGEDAIAAALREAEEELGIDPTRVHVIGPSDPYRTGSGYDITPVIAVVPPDMALVPNPAEVADWFEMPLADALDPARHLPKLINVPGSKARRFVEIDWDGPRIWGITAALLGRLAYRLDWTGAGATLPEESP